MKTLTNVSLLYFIPGEKQIEELNKLKKWLQMKESPLNFCTKPKRLGKQRIQEYCQQTNSIWEAKLCISVWLLYCRSSLEQSTALSCAFLD